VRISTFDQWPALFQDPGYEVIVDPVVYRIGELFLTEGSSARDNAGWDEMWAPIGQDIGAVVTFFDLLILHRHLPAFDYSVTFNPMSAQINTVGGEPIIDDIKVAGDVYKPTRDAVVGHLHDRMGRGPFVPKVVAGQIPGYLASLGYQWAPDIGIVEPELPDETSRTVARFLVGHLLFAGYAQMSGLPHVLSPRRGRLVAAAGLPVKSGVPQAEKAVWGKVGQRLHGVAGWRDEELAWTPSFLPYLLQLTSNQRGGPETLLKHALELRQKKSIKKYREIRRAALGVDDVGGTMEARRALADAAESIAKELGRTRKELAYTKSFIVGAGPQAIGYLSGAGLGLVIGGPPGGLLGGLAGAVAPEVLKPATERLWGWVIDRLPFVSSRKLLSRVARAEVEVGDGLANSLEAVWRRGYC
jgi:hypothetical protein